MILRSLIVVSALLLAVTVSAQRVGDVMANAASSDLDRSLHIFTATLTGGTQAVLSVDGETAQVNLIRAHLGEEAANYARGEYADPGIIDGSDMPGVAALRTSNGGVQVTFDPLPQGAQLRFETSDPVLVTAIHQWFEAQVRHYGADAILR